MKIRLAFLAAIGAAAYLGYHTGMKQGMAHVPTAAKPAAGKTVLYWQDPMVPGQRFDKPGKSPYMDMQLVPVYAEDNRDDGKVTISPRIQQNLGIRTAEVTRGNLALSMETVGNVAYDERGLVVLQARTSGYVEELGVRATLDPVRKGQVLARLYFPDWIAAQEDFLTAKKLEAHEGAALVDAARARMRLAGMSDEQIGKVESSGRVEARQTITAPVSGVVTELGIREGMTVSSGTLMFRINGLDTVWVNADVPEDIAEKIHPGNPVEVHASALPGVSIKGRVNAVLPGIDPATRTLKARIALENPGHQLVPGMFATVNVSPALLRDVLLIPSEAVIQTGKRSLVILAQDDDRFSPVEIETGRESNGLTEVIKGLTAGQRIVASGQFLIDSEASIRGTGLRMGQKAPAPATHHGTGRIEAIDKDTITISHGPIPSLQWPAMTMNFRIAQGGLPQNIRVGDTVDFEIRPDPDGEYGIVSIAKVSGNRP